MEKSQYNIIFYLITKIMFEPFSFGLCTGCAIAGCGTVARKKIKKHRDENNDKDTTHFSVKYEIIDPK